MKALPHIALVTASEMTLKAFMLGHVAAWAQRFQVTAFANCGDKALLQRHGVAVPLVQVGIERQISPIRDLAAVWALFRHFRRGRFDVVFSVTPKAGLLAMLAASAAGVPVRIHIFTGQVWATRRGAARLFLKALDRVTAMLATHVLADSESQRQFLIAEGVLKPETSTILAGGSISGVDTERFRPDGIARKSIRQTLGLGEEKLVLLFLGRLNPDKGVLDLAAAFADMAPSLPDLHLLFVGPDEEGMQTQLLSACAEVVERVHFVTYTDKPEAYMAAADVFCLPSYREGFGSVVIEAAAVGVPAVASRIYGLTDAVADGETGFLHRPGDVSDLGRVLRLLLDDRQLRNHMGDVACARAKRDFSRARVTQAFTDYLLDTLA
jgi:glycosyltransferase involved in cell wall biosynthesis